VIVFKCPCGWLATDAPADDIWDDTEQLIEDHTRDCPMNENDGPATDQSTGTAADPNHYHEERTKMNDTANSSSTAWHPVWCDPQECTIDDAEPLSLAHHSTPATTGRGWDNLTGAWNAEAQLMCLDWQDDDDKRTFAAIRFNDSEDLHLHDGDLTQLIGFLESLRTRLREATA